MQILRLDLRLQASVDLDPGEDEKPAPESLEELPEGLESARGSGPRQPRPEVLLRCRLVGQTSLPHTDIDIVPGRGGDCYRAAGRFVGGGPTMRARPGGLRMGSQPEGRIVAGQAAGFQLDEETEERELESIVDYGESSPTADPVFRAESELYWTSTTSVGDPTMAFAVAFQLGSTFTAKKNPPTGPGAFNVYVRAVRTAP